MHIPCAQNSRRRTSSLPRTRRQGPAFVMVAILVSVAPAIRAADYVEITVELNSTWKSQSKTNQHSRIARCVVGTNGWYIAGNFLENADAHYWLIGTNVIERRINDGLRLCILTAPF